MSRETQTLNQSMAYLPTFTIQDVGRFGDTPPAASSARPGSASASGEPGGSASSAGFPAGRREWQTPMAWDLVGFLRKGSGSWIFFG